MQIIKNIPANRCSLRLLLLIASAFCFIGCEASSPEKTAPDKTDSPPVVDMDIKAPDESSSNKTPDGENEEAMVPPASGDAPGSGGTEMEQGTDSDDSEPSDSPGPSLNAPKSTSLNSGSEQDKSFKSTSSKGSEENASLAMRFFVVEC